MAERFNFGLIHKPIKDYYFVIEEGILKVRNLQWGRRFSIHLNLQKEVNRIKRQKRSFKKDLLCRSLGYQNQKDFKVIDGTLGLGRDALHMISFGIHVLGFEINPTAFCLLEEALDRTSHELSVTDPNFPAVKRGIFSSRFVDLRKFLEIEFMNCLKGLSLFSKGIRSLYLDPMFEETKKKSKPGKSMAFLREISRETCDVQRVIALALNKGIKRVVIKRPINGNYLYGKPNFLYKGKLIRYDVYTG